MLKILKAVQLASFNNIRTWCYNMKAFADNPFFFFVDKVPPIFSVDASENVRKIVELSDTGCDARIPIVPGPLHTNRYYSPKSSKVKSDEDWKSYYEEMYGSRSYRERFRGQSGRNVTDTGESYFKPKEDENIRQNHWQKRFTVEDTNDGTMFAKDPENRNTKINERASSEKTRARRWKRDDTHYVHCDHDVAPQSFQDETDLSIEDHPYQPRKVSKASSGRAQFTHPNGSKIDPRVYNQDAVADENRTRSLRAEYPDMFEPEEVSPTPSSRDHWQRSNMSTFLDMEHLLDETSQKNHKSTKHNSKNVRTTSSTKPSDAGRLWENAHAARIRSRTCSPPADRRKRTRSVSKSAGQDGMQAEDRCAPQISRESRHAPGNAESIRHDGLNYVRFMDRAVDKDSISDVLTVSTSTNHLSNATLLPGSIDEGESKEKSGYAFWEFIPLEDEGDQNGKENFESEETACLEQKKTNLGSKNYASTKRLANDKDDTVNSQMKRKAVQSKTTNVKPLDNSVSQSRPLSAGGSINNKKNLSSDSSRMESTKPLVDSNEAKLGSKIPSPKTRKNSEIPQRVKNQDPAKCDSKDQGKIQSKLAFGWTGKSSRYLKRPSEATKSESNDDKKKKVDNGVLKDEKKPGMNFVEKTAACLKRKLERSKEAASISNSMIIEKKDRPEVSTSSRLPIRIGNRVRSKNPIASSVLGNLKGQVSAKEQNKGATGSTEDSIGQQSSIRSRTKPRVRQSVEQTKTVDSIGASINSAFVESVQASVEIKNSSRGGQKGDSKFVGSNIGDKLIDGVYRKKSLSRTKLSKSEKLGVNIGEREIGNLKVSSAEQDQRKRDIANRSYGRETNRRINLGKEVDAGVAKNDFKEKCLFHFNGEQNIICNSYCNKEHRNLNAFRSGRSIAVRARI